MALVFSKSTYTPEEAITGFTEKPGKLTLRKLSLEYRSFDVSTNFNLGLIDPGSYGVTFTSDGSEDETSALEVIAEPFSRVRYGFISEFSSQANVSENIEWAKKLHLSSVQFYDWAWKHEFLVSDDDSYGDPLGADISKSTIKELIDAYAAVGILAAGYAAVYAVDSEGWKRWEKSGLFNGVGEAYKLGENFLWLVDPADPAWLAHLLLQLKQAQEFGFKAFHLDQYGWPKIAFKHDGTTVNLAEQFPLMLEEISEALPDSTLIFNNVNDFPTWSTSKSPQHAIYIEVWEPHSTYRDLADLVAKSRLLNPLLPVILSAYLNPFKDFDTHDSLNSARASLALAFAAISSGGASHLITGGDGRVLHDPYYVRNYLADVDTRHDLESYFDFLVTIGDFIYDATTNDITMTSAFGINEEIVFESEDLISHDASFGKLWARIFRGDSGLSIHFINLLDQTDSLWDSAKVSSFPSTRVKINIDLVGNHECAHIGYAQSGSYFEKLDSVKVDGRLIFDLEIKGPWTFINIPNSSN
jgi:dextranase